MNINNIDICSELLTRYGNSGALIYFEKTFNIYYESFYFVNDTILLCSSDNVKLNEIEWIYNTFINTFNGFKKMEKYKLMHAICKQCNVEIFEYLDVKLGIFKNPDKYYEIILANALELNYINNTIHQNISVAEYLTNKFNKHKVVVKDYLIIDANDENSTTDTDSDSDTYSDEDIDINTNINTDINTDTDTDTVIDQKIEMDVNRDIDTDTTEDIDSDNFNNQCKEESLNHKNAEREFEDYINQNNDRIDEQDNEEDDEEDDEEDNYHIVQVYDYVPLTDIEKKYSLVVNTKQLTKKKKVLGITKQVKISKNDNPQCLICLDDSKELLQLNCNHFCCITCLCKWYRNNNNENKDSCVYCKQNINWSECKIVKKT